MNNEQIFKFINAIAFFNWILLMAAPRWKWSGKITLGVTITILGIIYIFLMVPGLNAELFSSFNTLAGIKSLFTQDVAVLAGWAHYLAFDLMVGWYIVSDSAKNNINRFVIIPCLLFTFMLGPTGLLFYFMIRIFKTKSYFIKN
jgi:Domain of unknown function (DUF4281)